MRLFADAPSSSASKSSKCTRCPRRGLVACVTPGKATKRPPPHGLPSSVDATPHRRHLPDRHPCPSFLTPPTPVSQKAYTAPLFDSPPYQSSPANRLHPVVPIVPHAQPESDRSATFYTESFCKSRLILSKQRPKLQIPRSLRLIHSTAPSKHWP